MEQTQQNKANPESHPKSGKFEKHYERKKAPDKNTFEKNRRNQQIKQNPKESRTERLKKTHNVQMRIQQDENLNSCKTTSCSL